MKVSLENYLSNEHQIFSSQPFEKLNPKHRIYSPYCQFISTYHNVTNEYVNPLNNISLCSIPDISFIEDQTIFFSRDGLIPLLDFMLKYEEPNSNTAQIVVYDKFIDYIPSKWSKNVIPYEIAYKEIWEDNIFQPPKRENLLITVYPCDFIISITNIEKILNSVDKEKYKNVYIFIQYGHSFFKYHDEALKYAYNIINTTNKIFKINTEIITEKHLFGKCNLKDFDFIELNHNGILWSDNILTQRILFAGARPYFRNKIKKSSTHYFNRQSSSHGIILKEKRECGKKFDALKRFILNLNVNNINRILDQKELCSFLFGYLENEIEPTRYFSEF